VYTKDGTERWMLIHLEIQGWNDKHFSKRMFQYYYRVLDRYDKPVTAMAIFTGRDGKNIMESDNPFAIVLLVAKLVSLKKIKNKHEFDLALLGKKELIVRLLEEKKIFSERKIDAIRTFLDNYVAFNSSEIYRIFIKRVDRIMDKTNTMNIFEQVAEIKAAEALEKGLKKGRAEERELIVKNLLANTEFSPEKIASLANTSLAFVKKIKKGIRTK
jgi:hypothetical protein